LRFVAHALIRASRTFSRSRGRRHWRVLIAVEFSPFVELSPQIAIDTFLFSITYDGSAIALYGARDAAYSKHD
jgi:hypothetical protein